MKIDNKLWILKSPLLLQLIMLPTVYLWFLINKNKPSRHNNTLFIIVYILMAGTVTTFSFNIEIGFGFSILLIYLIINPFSLSLAFGVFLFDVYLAPFLLSIWGAYEVGIDMYVFLKTGNWDVLFISDWPPLKTVLTDHSDWVGLKNIVYFFTNKIPDWVVVFCTAGLSVYFSSFIISYCTDMRQRLKTIIDENTYTNAA